MLQEVHTPELVLYLIISAFNLVIVDRFMKVLFKEVRVKRIFVSLSYVVFYVLTSMFHLYIRNPWLDALAILVGYIILSLVYEVSFIKRVRKISAILAYTFLAEGVIQLVMRSITINVSDL
jgi:hypothetical protein